MTLREIAREIPGVATVEGNDQTRVFGVQHDSRRVRPQDLFVVRRGEKHDARQFVPRAIESGATAILAEGALPLTNAKGLPILRVPDVAEGLAYAAAAVYGHPAFSLDIIGVTGTNGKTTTTHLLRAAIDGAYEKSVTGIVGTIGHKFDGKTIEAAHTTPEADELARVMAVMRKRGANTVAMEVSSIALVLRRVTAVRFRVAAFTNLTQDHLDFHGSMEAYAAAKMELFTTMAPGLAVVNIDDPFGVKVASACKCKVLRVRTRPGPSSSDADVYPEAVETRGAGMRIRARFPVQGTIDIPTRLIGAHNVENVLIAMATVAALDLDVKKAALALATEVGAPGRLERCDGPEDDVVVLVDYAHTPDALARALDAVRAAAEGKRVICVFGCGGDRDPSKREPMGRAAGSGADLVIVTNDNPRTEDPEVIARSAANGVRSAGKEPIVELDRARAIERAISAAGGGDLVLIAGKGHEDYQIVGTEKRAFDDRVEARRALAARRGAR